MSLLIAGCAYVSSPTVSYVGSLRVFDKLTFTQQNTDCRAFKLLSVVAIVATLPTSQQLLHSLDCRFSILLQIPKMANIL